MATHTNGPARAIALVGPAGSGKTTLAHALSALSALGEGGRTPPKGPPGASNDAAFLAFTFMGERYSLIDLPGAADFAAEMDFTLPAADLALVVADPDPDKAILLQPYLKILEELRIPHAILVNKIDQARVRVRDVLAALQPMSAAPLVMRQIPIWKDERIAGFIDLALERAYVYRVGEPSERIDIPNDLAQREAEARFHLLEQLADFDDALMEQLLSDMTPTQDAVFADLAGELSAGQIAPVFLGAAAQGFGMRRLLKALRHDTPAPARAAERLGFDRPSAFAMKVSHAGQAGKLTYIRALGGEITEGAALRLPDGATGKIGALFALQGDLKKAKTIPEGEIGALAKIDSLNAGDKVRMGADPLPPHAPSPRYPVYQLAIATEDRKDDVRLSGALTKLSEEDAGLGVAHDAATHEIVLLGQGEAHLRLVLERLQTRFNVKARAAAPHTPYRESIRKSATKRARHKKQTGGHGQFGEVVIELAPLPRGEGFRFTDKITGGAIPKQWIPAVAQGAQDAMERGPIGFPVVDVAVTLTDGAFHAVDSSEHAFRAAGRQAMSEALKECQPVLLEPIERLTIAAPASATSRITAAAASRNGQILGFAPRESWVGWDIIDVYLPHAERQDFILELRGLTQGLASFDATFDHMAELTGRRADDIIHTTQAAR